jgi:polysaccharide transporter, PST family
LSISKSLLRYGGFALSVTTARVVGTLITAATFPFLVRRLGVDVYGLWSYVIAVCAFTGLVANPGLTTYAAQQVAARRQEAFETVSDVLVLRVLAAGVAVVAVLVVASFEVRQDVRFLLKWYGVASVVTGSLSLDYLMSSLELFHAQAFISITQQSLYAVGIFTMVRAPKDVIWVPVSTSIMPDPHSCPLSIIAADRSRFDGISGNTPWACTPLRRAWPMCCATSSR